MEYCKTCIFYDAEYNEMMQGTDDFIVEGEEQHNKYYCRVYDEHAPFDVVEGRKRCEHYTEEL